LLGRERGENRQDKTGSRKGYDKAKWKKKELSHKFLVKKEREV